MKGAPVVNGGAVFLRLDVVAPRTMSDRATRVEGYVKAIVDGQPVEGTLRIPRTAGDLVVSADLKGQQLTASLGVRAPEDKGERGRIGWLTGQLRDSSDDVIIESYAKNARVPIAASLGAVRADRSILLSPAQPTRQDRSRS